MAQVKILVKGYTTKEEQGRSCSTITLIKDKDINIVVDPGTVKDKQIIIEALKKEGLTLEDIDYVFITHAHIDHCRNIAVFPNAKTLGYWSVWENDMPSAWNPDFSYDIEIIKTPGHSLESLSFFVKTDKGTVAIVGDVFWKQDSPKDDPYASDKEKLKKSRELVLKKANFIIPGHGDIYEVD